MSFDPYQIELLGHRSIWVQTNRPEFICDGRTARSHMVLLF